MTNPPSPAPAPKCLCDGTYRVCPVHQFTVTPPPPATDAVVMTYQQWLASRCECTHHLSSHHSSFGYCKECGDPGGVGCQQFTLGSRAAEAGEDDVKLVDRLCNAVAAARPDLELLYREDLRSRLAQLAEDAARDESALAGYRDMVRELEARVAALEAEPSGPWVAKPYNERHPDRGDWKAVLDLPADEVYRYIDGIYEPEAKAIAAALNRLSTPPGAEEEAR